MPPSNLYSNMLGRLLLLSLSGLLTSMLHGATIFNSGLSHLEVHVPKAGLLSFAGHEHTIVASEFGAVLQWISAGDPLSLVLTVPVSGLRVTDEKLDSDDREKVRQTMLSEKVLSGDAFGIIRFETTAIEAVSKDRWNISGNVVIRNKTVPADFPVDVRTTESGHLRVSGTVVLQLADFGIKPVSALGGTIRTGKSVEVRFDFISQETINN